jgi:hypothetical protein
MLVRYILIVAFHRFGRCGMLLLTTHDRRRCCQYAQGFIQSGGI